MKLIFCFIIGFIGGFFFSTAISVSDKTQDDFKKNGRRKTMPRYIDAEKVVKWSYSEPRYSDSVNDRTDLRDFLLSLPTVSPDEVRGVVHCKDCKWCHAGYCEKYDDLIPWGCANKPWEDWFCADGKRQETIKEEQDAD